MDEKELQMVKSRFGIVGSDPRINRAIEIAVQVAPTDLSVLVTGESGVGKEFFPQIIHQYSTRKHFPYIAVNCGAIPEGLVDSELFGHEKGSFSGAINERKGFFETADGGTIFLDEVGELPLSIQARLLRVLEVGEFMRVGSSKVLKTNVRVVAATNVGMLKAVAEGKFREDLYYRLCTVPINVPSLRERGNDISFIFRKFAAMFAERYATSPVRLTEDAVSVLCSYDWPGNVRQLKNVVEQISILEKDDRMITSEILSKYLPRTPLKAGNLPVVVSSRNDGEHSYENEREMLFQIIFELRKEVSDLKRVVSDMVNSGHSMAGIDHYDSRRQTDSYTELMHADTVSPSQRETTRSGNNGGLNKNSDTIHDVDLMTDINYNLGNAEKETIKRVLYKHHNSRREAAKELNISERTLYRKIKEYGID